ncbi:MAG: outer membrane protein assembly factor BamD [Rikenellaceae bacterium]
MKTYRLMLFLFVGIFLCSCSEYSSILKGRDYEKQYKLGLKYYDEKKDQRAMALLDNVNPIYAATERADTIRFYLSNLTFRDGEYEQSAQLFDMFRKTYGRSSFTRDAEFMYGMSFYMLSPNSERDQLYSAKAISAFNEFIYRYPNDKNTAKAQLMIDELMSRINEKEFKVGETYYNIGYYNSAITTFKNILKRNPDVPRREDIRYLMLKSYYNYARQSVPSKQKERFFDVIDAYYSLVSEYPATQYQKTATRMYKNAQSFTDGTAEVSDLTVEVKATKNDIYAKRNELQRRILDYEISDRNKNKVKNLKAKLEQVEASIEEIENKKAAEDLIIH